MMTEPALLVWLDLGGTFTYAVNGGLTAVRAARLDIAGVVTLAMVSGLGGGIIRDILLGALPPATFSDSPLPGDGQEQRPSCPGHRPLRQGDRAAGRPWAPGRSTRSSSRLRRFHQAWRRSARPRSPAGSRAAGRLHLAGRSHK